MVQRCAHVDEHRLVDYKEAVMELEKDDVVIKALGEEFVKVYTKVKRDEWRSFVSEVTQWEIDNYLTRI